jgi:hypothetical protein
MWETIIVGIVGLGGIAGTFFAPYYVQERLERRREAREFRRVRRLVLEEVETIQMHLEMILDEGRAPTHAPASELFPTAQWEENRRVLAESLSDAIWEPLPRYFHTLPRARELVTRAEPGAQLDEETRRLLNDSLELVRDISTSLEAARRPPALER